MTLSEMRRALETADPDSGDTDDSETSENRPQSRLPPESRGVKESRSLIVEVDLAPLHGGRKGTLTFANSVSELRRAGSSRIGGEAPRKPLRRTPPSRAESCANG